MKQMTFQELTILSMEALSKQLPVTVEQARAQVQSLKYRGKEKKKMAKRPNK